MKKDKVYLNLNEMTRLKLFISKQLYNLDSKIEFTKGLLNRKGYIDKDYYYKEIGKTIKEREYYNYMLYILNFNIDVVKDINEKNNTEKLDFKQLEI